MTVNNLSAVGGSYCNCDPRPRHDGESIAQVRHLAKCSEGAGVDADEVTHHALELLPDSPALATA